MNVFESLLYALISGITELLPISSSAHQYLMVEIFGVEYADPILNFLIHLAVIAAIFHSCKKQISHLSYALLSERSRGKHLSREKYDLRFIKTATIPLVIGLFVFTYLPNGNFDLADISLICLANGFLLFISSRALQGNKTSRSMTAIDAAAVGVLGSLAVFPGVSRTGVALSVPVIRGADRQATLNWALILSIPALAVLLFIDFLRIFSMFQPVSFVVYLGYLLATGLAFLGASGAIALLRFMSVKNGFAGFAYYAWGTALFAFILYLI